MILVGGAYTLEAVMHGSGIQADVPTSAALVATGAAVSIVGRFLPNSVNT